MCSSLTAEGGSHEALEAMRLGRGGLHRERRRPGRLRRRLVHRRADHQGQGRSPAGPNPAGPEPKPPRPLRTAPAQTGPGTGTAPRTAPVASLDPALEKAISGCRGVVIGSSTGGPPVLEQLVCAIPAQLPRPRGDRPAHARLFTKSLAERLDRIAKVRVTLVDKAMLAEPGNVYIARGGNHARVVRRAGRVTVEPTSEPTDAMYKPSADALFTSAAKAWAAGGFAIVITGMGADGSEGAKHMKEAGATIVAQNEETSVVYGMPRAVAENGTSSAALTPNELAALLSKAGAASSPATAGSFLKQSA